MPDPSDDFAGIPAEFRNPVIHDRGPSSYPGDYQVTDAALKNYGIARELFGTTEVLLPGGGFRVKDYQYLLEDGSVGMTFLPVNDEGAAAGPDGNVVYSSVLVDELLRTKMGLKASDPLFVFMYFIHPELNSGSAADFAKSDKIELGITHWGAYHGGGRTTNSPPIYHNRGWGVKGEVFNDFGYPANVLLVSLEGVDQAMLNRNLCLVDSILNEGVRFPVDYKNSHFRAADINTALMFYRDWILEKQYLRTDSTWFTYCAAHKTIVANVGLNLPHNLQSFKEIFGEKEGADFFKTFSDFHFATFGVPFTPDLQTTFEPLWKKQGLTPAQIKPFSFEEYTAWDDARMAGALDHFTGFKPLAPDVGTPWAPQMGADVIYDFVQTYADFVDAGAIALCATLFAFGPAVIARTFATEAGFLSAALPIIEQATQAHARMYACGQPASAFGDSAYYKATFAALYGALGGKEADVDAVRTRVDAAPEPKSLAQSIAVVSQQKFAPEWLAWVSLARVRADWAAIMAGGQVAGATAYVDFMTAIQETLRKDRDLVVSNPKGIQFNTPPALGHMIGVGMFPCNKLVSLKPIVTVMNYTELEKKAD